MAPLVGSVPRFSLTILAHSVARRSFVLHNEQFQSAWAVSPRRVSSSRALTLDLTLASEFASRRAGIMALALVSTAGADVNSSRERRISFGRAPNVRTVRSPTRPTKLVYLFTSGQPCRGCARGCGGCGGCGYGCGGGCCIWIGPFRIC